MNDRQEPLPTVFTGDYSLQETIPNQPEEIHDFLIQKMATWQLGLSPIDAATNVAINKLQATQSPQSAEYLVDVFMHQLDAHQQTFNALLYDTNPNQQDAQTKIAIQGQINYLWQRAYETNPEAALSSLLNHLEPDARSGTQFKAEAINHLIFSKSNLESPIEHSGENQIHYFAKDFTLSGLDPTKTYDFVAAPGGMVLAIDQATHQVDRWYSLNLALPSNQPDHPYPIEPGISPLMLMGFADHPQPSDKLLQDFFQQLPDLVKAISPYLDQNSSALQYHLANFYHIWESNSSFPPLSPETQGFFDTFGESAMNLFTAGKFTPAETSQVMVWLTQMDQIEMSSGKETATFGRYVLGAINDISSNAHLAAQASTHSPSEYQAVRSLFYEQTRALILTARSLSLEMAENEDVPLNDSVLSFSISALSSQLSIINRLANTPLHTSLTQTPLPAEVIQNLITTSPTLESEAKQIIRTVLYDWFIRSVSKQTQAPYYHNLEELTARFYAQYQLIAEDTTRTTVNATIELPKHQSLIQADVNHGRLNPRDAANPYQVYFTGCGDLRIEKHLIEPIVMAVRFAKFIGLDPYPPSNNPTQALGLDRFHPYSLQSLYHYPELHHQADEVTALGSPLMEVVRFANQVEALASLAHLVKPNGILKTDNAFTRGANSYEAIIDAATQSLEPGQVQGVFERTWQMQNGDTIGKPFDGKDPLKFILLMREAGFTPLNFPADEIAIQAISDLTSIDDSYIENDDLDAYFTNLEQTYQTELTQVMAQLNISKSQILSWLSHAKEALYRIHNPDRAYNRWLVEFQKIAEPSPLFNALLQHVTQHFVLPLQVKQLAVN